MLRVVEPADGLFEETLRIRLLLGDRVAIPALMERLRSDRKEWWLSYCAYVWSDETDKACRSLLRAEIDRTGNMSGNLLYFFTRMLRVLHEEPARSLLKEFGPAMKDAAFVQAALYCGAPLLQNASDRVAYAQDKRALFAHLWSYFGFKERGIRDQLTVERVKRLEPYLQYFDQHSLSEVAEFCHNHDMLQWRLANVYPLLTPDIMARIEPNEADHFRQLDEYASQTKNSSLGWSWAKSFQRRGQTFEEAMLVARAWFDARDPVKHLVPFLNLVLFCGGRGDIIYVCGACPAWLAGSYASTIKAVEFAVKRQSID